MLASLENDAFRVHGTIKEGGDEYLVKRGGFSGVDVINQNPGSRVSFKDMVKRIKRITAKGGGPVIK
jgi:ribosomal protein L21